MTDQPTPPGTEGGAPPPVADAAGAAAAKTTDVVKPANPMLLRGYVGEEVRGAAKLQEAYTKATSGENVAEEARVAAQKTLDEGLKALREKITGRLKDDGHKAEYAKVFEAESAGVKKAWESVTKVTKVVAAAHDNPVKTALLGAAIAGVGMALPGKEVEKADGSKEKKTGFLKGALVAIGGAVALGIALNVAGPAKGFLAKEVARRAMNASAPAAGASI